MYKLFFSFIITLSKKETTLNMTCSYDVPKVDTSSGTSPNSIPLPSNVTDYIAENVCGILEIQQPSVKWDSIPLPELLFFIRKVTKKANVDVQTAIASLVLVTRFKRRLPKSAHGEYGTYHKIFLTSLLIAFKEFMPKTKEEEEEESEDSLDSNTTETDNTNDTNKSKEISNAKDINNVDSDTNSNLSASPSPSIISTTPSSTTPSDDEQEDDIYIFRDNSDLKQPRNGFDYKLKRPIINRKLSVISGLYNIEEVERMEREFMWRINGDDKVTEKDIRDYVETNRHALGIC